jgi:hypothetical protein
MEFAQSVGSGLRSYFDERRRRMQIKMLKVSASPALCADAGQIVTVDDEFAESLIAASAAEKHKADGREVAAVDPQRIEVNERERSLAAAEALKQLSANIVNSLRVLDHENDDDWTSGGEPAMNRLKILTGKSDLTRVEVSAAAPEFKRMKAEVNAPPVDAKPKQAAGGVAPSAARTSAP